MEEENKVDETINSSVEDNNEEEISSDENTENTGQESDLSEELERERQARQQLTARAKKAEAEAKALREKYESQKAKEEAEPKTQQTSPDIDERILKAQGMPDDLLKELKVIAQVRGVDLMDAQKDSVFQVIKTDYEKRQKSEEASLGASKGSGQAKPKKDFKTPGLTPEEHKDMWKKSV